MNNHSCVTCGSPPRFCRGAAIALDGGTPDTKDVTTPLRYLFRLALVLFAVSHILPAAVDCRNPRTRQQRVVCANPNLMDLDRHLSSVYEKALADVQRALPDANLNRGFVDALERLAGAPQ